MKKEAHISNNFTCHTWLPDGRLIVCTDMGEIMLLESSGDYKMLLAESPGEGFFIECIITYSKGFIIGGENGQIMIYEKSEEPKNPYHKIATLVRTIFLRILSLQAVTASKRKTILNCKPELCPQE